MGSGTDGLGVEMGSGCWRSGVGWREEGELTGGSSCLVDVLCQ